jgi:thiol-disulfide isomerase/thioredoxin
LAGGLVSLSDHRGKVVLINLWATWCPPCQSEVPVLEAAYQLHDEDGLIVLGVDMGEAASTVQAFVDRAGITYPVLLDTDSTLLSKYRALGLPVSIVVDREGIVRARSVGALTRGKLEGLLKTLLPEPQATGKP